MNHYLPILFSLSLFVLNWFIYSSTRDRISIYKHIPPFPSLDFSGSVDSIYSLQDGDHTTYWRKGGKNSSWDFELELRFSHILKSGHYLPVGYKELSIIPCEGYPSVSIHGELFQREGINVDKELRMPSDRLLSQIDIPNLKTPFLFDISKLISVDGSPRTTYDGEGMGIIGFRARLITSEGIPCLAEISLRK